MKQRIFKAGLWISLIAALGMSVFALLGTTYTKTYTRISVSGYGSFLSFSHTFVGRQDTVFFPITVSPAFGNRDTIAFYANVQTNRNGNDSVYVTWLHQYNFRSATSLYGDWVSQTIGIDSGAGASTAWTNRIYLVGPRSYNQGYPPFQRVVAIGGQIAGSKANEVNNLLQVESLKE